MWNNLLIKVVRVNIVVCVNEILQLVRYFNDV